MHACDTIVTTGNFQLLICCPFDGHDLNTIGSLHLVDIPDQENHRGLPVCTDERISLQPKSGLLCHQNAPCKMDGNRAKIRLIFLETSCNYETLRDATSAREKNHEIPSGKRMSSLCRPGWFTLFTIPQSQTPFFSLSQAEWSFQKLK